MRAAARPPRSAATSRGGAPFRPSAPPVLSDHQRAPRPKALEERMRVTHIDSINNNNNSSSNNNNSSGSNGSSNHNSNNSNNSNNNDNNNNNRYPSRLIAVCVCVCV